MWEGAYYPSEGPVYHRGTSVSVGSGIAVGVGADVSVGTGVSAGVAVASGVLMAGAVIVPGSLAQAVDTRATASARITKIRRMEWIGDVKQQCTLASLR